MEAESFNPWKYALDQIAERAYRRINKSTPKPKQETKINRIGDNPAIVEQLKKAGLL